MSFNENTRVKIPAILHLARLGYEYVSLAKAVWDGETNIFTDIFTESILRINPEMDESEARRLCQDVALALDNEDLGRAFYAMLVSTSAPRLIDFTNFDNNSFHVVTELTCKNGDDEFRPDITLLINGMPLAFIEVKKPNNRDGILAERERINVRFKNNKFRKFINVSQLLVFSNNMEYDDGDVEPIQGAFYATTSYQDANFNYFRDEENLDLEKLLKPEDEAVENFVLKDNNLFSIKHSPEFLTNKDPTTPTNRMLTSLFNRDRLAMILRYGFAYVQNQLGQIEKHILRYPQFFAMKAIERTIDKGVKKGIIWHTQGSGKTALAFYSAHYLTDYFQRGNIVPKFYFIVDRLDLMTQASREFSSRGLKVNTVNSKDDLIKHFRTRQSIHNPQGQREITVVNIQKFKDDNEALKEADYDLQTQRVYFLDEVHRSYNPNGSFLANLYASDRGAILIGLTGTPLIVGDVKSRDLFGKYIHKYYYNRSIADGYTLRLMREDIETGYAIQMKKVLDELEIKIRAGDIEKKDVFAHERFAEPMLDYIVEDFINSRRAVFNDHTVGGMVVCDSSAQAEKLFEIFVNKYNPEQKVIEPVDDYKAIKEPAPLYGEYADRQGRKLVASLILHNVGDKDERKQEVEDFKSGKIDLLFVYNMLLTGFDSARLKKLYLARLVKDHNLLQTLTRVNRPYKKFRYGYVVDFADIQEQFKKTNKAYFDELQEELGDEMQNYSDMFKSREEIERDIINIKDRLFLYDLSNAEVFSTEISKIEDRKTVLEIKKALETAKSIYNLIRLYGHFDLLEKLDFNKLRQMLDETARHLELLNLKESLQNDVDTTNLLNVALETVVFTFWKRSEEELVIADQLRDTLARTREAFNFNFDPKDPQFVNLYDELKRLFANRNLDEISQDEMKQNIGALEKIYQKVLELNRRNNLLRAKYENDAKYARLHKRIMEKGKISKRESEVREVLLDIKQKTDEKVLLNTNLLNNDGFFSGLVMQLLVNSFDRIKIPLEPDSAKFINNLLVREYVNEYQGVA
ncbi:MAG: type I restriction endonuclease subunit R [Anaerolineales bacterium]|nr:type I restriction endonuclease subunit R [Anaerolineales bacterium]